MRFEYHILATTHIDQNRYKLTKEALEKANVQIKEYYIPGINDHDPRNPPIGRIESGRVIELDDGEWGLEVELAIFEEGDEKVPYLNGKKLVPEIENPEKFKVMYDISYDNPEGKELIKKLTLISGEEPSLGIKRGPDPISILIIIFGFVGINIAIGFLRKLGANAADALQKTLDEYFKGKSDNDRLIQWSVTKDVNGNPVEIWIIATNPKKDSIKKFFETGLGNIDDELLEYDIPSNISRVVFKYEKGKLSQMYSVRADGFPIQLKKK